MLLEFYFQLTATKPTRTINNVYYKSEEYEIQCWSERSIPYHNYLSCYYYIAESLLTKTAHVNINWFRLLELVQVITLQSLKRNSFIFLLQELQEPRPTPPSPSFLSAPSTLHSPSFRLFNIIARAVQRLSL